MKDEKGLGNATQPSSGMGGFGMGRFGMVPHKLLFPNSIIIEEYQRKE